MRGGMEVAVAFTIWISFGAFVFFGVIDAPALFGRTAITLCAAEFLATLVWAVGSADCVERPCGALAETARTAAGLDIPALTGFSLALAALHGLREARSW